MFGHPTLGGYILQDLIRTFGRSRDPPAQVFTPISPHLGRLWCQRQLGSMLARVKRADGTHEVYLAQFNTQIPWNILVWFISSFRPVAGFDLLANFTHASTIPSWPWGEQDSTYG